MVEVIRTWVSCMQGSDLPIVLSLRPQSLHSRPESLFMGGGSVHCRIFIYFVRVGSWVTTSSPDPYHEILEVPPVNISPYIPNHGQMSPLNEY